MQVLGAQLLVGAVPGDDAGEDAGGDDTGGDACDDAGDDAGWRRPGEFAGRGAGDAGLLLL